MKSNKKGYMLVEIIVAFTIAMAMLYFLVNIVINIKGISDDYYVEAKLEKDQLLMTNIIMKDVNKYNVDEIIDDISNNSVFIHYSNGDYKKVSIENNYFKYGICEYNEYEKKCEFNDENIFVKEIDNRISTDNSGNNDHLVISSYVDNNSKNRLLINFDMKEIYNNNNFDLRLNIDYNSGEIEIKKNFKVKYVYKDNDNIVEEYDSSETCVFDIEGKCEKEITLKELDSDEYNGWYDNSGCSGDSNIVDTIDGDKTYYACKVNKVVNCKKIIYECSGYNRCELSQDKKGLRIMKNTTLILSKDSSEDCNNKSVQTTLVGGGSGGNAGDKRGYNGGAGGNGGYINSNVNFLLDFNSNYSVIIGSGGAAGKAGGDTTIKKDDEIILSSINGNQIKNTCRSSCYFDLIYDNRSYGRYGAPGATGIQGNYYEGYYGPVPSNGAAGASNSGNGGNGGDGNVNGLIRQCGTGNCNSSNNISYSYAAGNGGAGGSGIVILYNPDGWQKKQ